MKPSRHVRYHRTVRSAAVLALALATAAGAIGDAAREVALVDVSGTSTPFGDVVDSAIAGGARVQLILFWSLYEPQSRRSLRALDLYLDDASENDEVVAVGVAVPEYSEGPDAVEEFAGKARVTLPIYLDPLGRLVRALTREAPSTPEGHALAGPRRAREARLELPITVVIGPTGRVSAVLTGEHAAATEALDAAIDRARAGGEGSR